MQRRMSFKQYRTLDLCSFASILCVCEALTVLAATRWFPGEPYTLSLSAAVTAIVLVRWGIWAAVPAALGGLAFCLAGGANAVQLAVYVIGNQLALLLAPMLRRGGWKRLRENVLLALVYGAAVSVLMQAGRAALALALGYPAALCFGFLTTDVLSTLFAALVVWICRRLDGMLEEQRHYILRIQKEQEEREYSGGMNA